MLLVAFPRQAEVGDACDVRLVQEHQEDGDGQAEAVDPGSKDQAGIALEPVVEGPAVCRNEHHEPTARPQAGKETILFISIHILK